MTRRKQAGFSLIELMVVIAILAISVRFIVPSFLSDVPEAATKAEARKLAANLSFLRSESRLRARRYGLEFVAPDNEVHRYRILLPRDDQIVHEGSETWIPDEDVPDDIALDWYDMPKEVYFIGVHVGVHVGAREESTPKARKIFFDPRGRTSQKVIYLGHRQNKDVVYSIVVPPLTGAILVEKGRSVFQTASDGDF